MRIAEGGRISLPTVCYRIRSRHHPLLLREPPHPSPARSQTISTDRICFAAVRTWPNQFGVLPTPKSLAAPAQPTRPVGAPPIVARWLRRKTAVPPKPPPAVFRPNPPPWFRPTPNSTGFPVQGVFETFDSLNQTLPPVVSAGGLIGENVLFKTKSEDLYVHLTNTGVKAASKEKQRDLPAPLSFSWVDLVLKRKQKDVEDAKVEEKEKEQVGEGAHLLE